MKSFIFNLYFYLTFFDTRDYFYFESNLRLTLLIKVSFTKHHVMQYSKHEKILFLSSLFLWLCLISLGWYGQKNVVKSWTFRKKITKGGGQVVYGRKTVQTNFLHTMILANHIGVLLLVLFAMISKKNY